MSDPIVTTRLRDGCVGWKQLSLGLKLALYWVWMLALFTIAFVIGRLL